MLAVGVSHYTIKCPSQRIYRDAVAFYVELGFLVVSEIGDAEAWLHLFAANTTLDGITLCVTADEPADGFDAIAFAAERASDQPRLNEFSSTSETLKSAWVCLVVADIQSIAAGLKQRSHAHAIKGGTNGPVFPVTGISSAETLICFDPAGHLIVFTEQSSHLPKFAGVNPHSTAAKPTQQSSSAHPLESFGSNLEMCLPMDASSIRSPANAHVKLSHPKRIGILTSGGDSSGMNAAVRAITRVALQRGCIPYAIYEGYEGLVDGGDMIKRLKWEDVRGLLAIGGTFIGTARSARFRTREGRLKAAHNMILNGIDALVVIGGDGSLTGADMLRSEWKGLVDELVATGKIELNDCAHLRENLTIVGLVGSIDNDMSSTDITIGAVTSLHRICESLDSLTSTALSHQRAFVVEVMGRHCGWLGLMASIAIGADWVFLPERPPPLDTTKYGENWEDEMCERLAANRKIGNRKTIVLVCEGAIDRQLKPIKPDYIKTVIEKRLGLDTRVTTLGHVQRGGTPCAYDRYLATIQGVEAVEAVLKSTPETPSPMIGISQNKITAGPLMDAVKLTQEVAAAIAKKDFKKAMELRDPDFTAAYDAYIESHMLSMEALKPASEKSLRVGIIHVGAPAGGMNAATLIAARLCLNRGHTPLAIRNGFSGLVRDEVAPLNWQDLIGWQVVGGSELGTNRDHPQPVIASGVPKISPKGASGFVDCGLIAFHMQKHGIQALLLIGGFEGFTSLVTLSAARSIYPAFCIPMVHLPATISNNVPGTEFSIGSDTALNAIVEACDRIKLSASASQKRVFVVEVQGGSCGYLAVLAGLAAGATNVYIPEDGISLDTLQRDVKHLTARYTSESKGKMLSEGRVILRSEFASQETYSTEVISSILRAEGKGVFDSRTSVLGHLQQGGIPSPLDRIRATRLAVNCIDWIESAFEEASAASDAEIVRFGNATTGSAATTAMGRQRGYTNKPEHACVVGIQGAKLVFSPVENLVAETDMAKRRGKASWWMGFSQLIRVLSKYYYRDGSETEKEGEDVVL